MRPVAKEARPAAAVAPPVGAELPDTPEAPGAHGGTEHAVHLVDRQEEPALGPGDRRGYGRPSAGVETPAVVRILSIRTAERPTPVYWIRDQSTHAKPSRLWHVITVEYESRPDWIDELTFDYWVQTRGGRERAAGPVFSRRVTYLDVEAGVHRSVVYLHPNTFARFGPARRAGVSVKSAGVEVAYATLAGDQDRSWIATSDRSRLLEGRDTPFWLIDNELFESEQPAPLHPSRGTWRSSPGHAVQ
jgi:hypothetical protein